MIFVLLKHFIIKAFKKNAFQYVKISKSKRGKNVTLFDKVGKIKVNFKKLRYIKLKWVESEVPD